MLGYQFCPRIADLTDQRLWRIDPHAHYGPLDPVALADYGRIARTLHLLAVLDPDDDSYRRTVNTQLTVQESRHRLARKLFFGQRGELRQRYREGQEDQLSALGLVLNAVVLWNTRYTDAAVHQLRTQGYPVADEHATRLSPARRPAPERARPLRVHAAGPADRRATPAARSRRSRRRGRRISVAIPGLQCEPAWHLGRRCACGGVRLVGTCD